MPEVTLPLIEDIPSSATRSAPTSLLTWVALLLVPLLALFLFRTPRGLRLRSVGEKPRAAETASACP